MTDTVAHVETPHGFWQTVREAIRGTHHDYTSGPIGRAIILLAVPMVLEMVMESVFAVVDAFWVAHLGPNAVATVGLTESMLTLVYTAAMGLSIGVTAMVARRIGEKNPAGAAEAAVQGITLGVIAAAIIAVLGVLLAPRLLGIMGASPDVIALGHNYTRVMLGGKVVLYQLYRLWRRDGRVVIHRHQIALKPAVMKTLLRLSGTGTFQVFVGMASWIGLTRINASFGAEGLAGYTIAIRIIIFALLPSWGLANAAATMVGQALGAGKPDRGEQAVWRAAFYNVCFLGVAGVIFIILANPIAHLFTSDPTVVVIAADCLRIISYGYLFYAYGMVLTNSFNGAGDTWTPTWLNLFCFWLWEIPLAWVLARHFNLGPQGVAWAVTIAFSTLAVASAVLFRRGRWKLKAV